MLLDTLTKSLLYLPQTQCPLSHIYQALLRHFYNKIVWTMYLKYWNRNVTFGKSFKSNQIKSHHSFGSYYWFESDPVHPKTVVKWVHRQLVTRSTAVQDFSNIVSQSCHAAAHSKDMRTRQDGSHFGDIIKNRSKLRCVSQQSQLCNQYYK
jgi:hypothetical protein